MLLCGLLSTANVIFGIKVIVEKMEREGQLYVGDNFTNNYFKVLDNGTIDSNSKEQFNRIDQFPTLFSKIPGQLFSLDTSFSLYHNETKTYLYGDIFPTIEERNTIYNQINNKQSVVIVIDYITKKQTQKKQIYQIKINDSDCLKIKNAITFESIQQHLITIQSAPITSHSVPSFLIGLPIAFVILMIITYTRILSH